MRGISSEWWCRVAAMLSDLSDPTPDEVKLFILSALRTLSLSGQQHVLVHYWAATKSGNAYLLTTTDQPFGLYGNDEGLELYREGCLRHKLYIHPDENVAFGLPGYAFKNGTFLLTQNLHGWDGDQHPPCEAAIFDQIWGAFAVPVIFANKRFGVLEFVMNTPKDSYYNDIYEVYKALEFVGFQSSIYIDPPRRTFTPPTRDRITDSSMYDNYDCLVPDMGLSKSEAMKRVTSRYNLSMPAKGTFSRAHKTAGIPEWPWVRNTTTRAYSPPETIINPIPFEIAAAVEPQDAHLVGIAHWPYIRDPSGASSSAPETRSNPTASEAASSIGTPDSILTSVCDKGISEPLREQTSTPIASAFEAQLYQSWDSMSWEQTPTIEPSALGLSECFAFESELFEMGEDQDEPRVHDQGRFNDILESLEECIHDTSGMGIDTATSVLPFE